MAYALRVNAQDKESEGRQDDLFLTTQWSLILGAWDGGETTQMRQLEALAKAYWKPLHAYAERFAVDGEEPDDLVQGFFAKIMAKEGFGDIAPERGRFRAFLLRSFRNHTVDRIRKARAAKRGGRAAESPIEEEITGSDEAESAYDRAWAVSLADLSYSRLKESYASRGQDTVFEAISPFLTSMPEDGVYDEIASQLGMSRASIATAVTRMRARYGQLLKNEVGRTVAEAGEIENELRYLVSLISQ